jgi:hypothetical protein
MKSNAAATLLEPSNRDLGERKKIRIQFELLEERGADLNRIMMDTGIATKRDLLEQAITLLEWAVDETKQGNRVGFQSTAGSFQPLLFNPLRNVARIYAKKSQESPH